MAYTAYILNPKSVDHLLEVFPPKYAEIKCHHITYQYGATSGDDIPEQKEIYVVGYHDNGAMQVLSVRLGVNEKQVRRDNSEPEKYLHITLSFDPEQNISAKHSNDVLENIVKLFGEQALFNLDRNIKIDAKPYYLSP